jgi:GNAT superfamily N-acetyltransferase
MGAMNEPKLNIRPATPVDAPTVFRLVTALAEYEKLTPPDAGAALRMAQDMSRRPPRFQAFLAELGGEPVGCAICFETYSTFLAAPKYYVEDLFILPAYRGKGYGHALFRALAREALKRGCALMEWTALDWNKPAHDFYKGMGAKHMEMWQVFRLEAPEMAKVAQG